MCQHSINECMQLSTQTCNVTMLLYFQVYTFAKSADSSFQVTKLTSGIPLTLTSSQCSSDGIKILNVHNFTHLFIRSQSNMSRIYYGYQEWKKGEWSKFVPIGDDDDHLAYDFDVVENTFVRVSKQNGCLLRQSSKHLHV